MKEKPVIQDFFNTVRVPVRRYEKNEPVHAYANGEFTPNPLLLLLPYVEIESSPLGYIVTSEHLFFGFVRIDGMEGFYAVGPTTTFRPTTALVRALLKEMGQHAHHEAMLLEYLQKIPPYTVGQSRHMLSILDFLVNGEYEREMKHVQMKKLKIPSDYIENMQLLTIEHFGSDLEKEITSFVEYGRQDLMEKYLDSMFTGKDGIPDISPDAERALKNLFIFSLGIISRTAYRSGLEYNTVNEMTSYFLTRIEDFRGSLQISLYIRRMFMTFANMVAMIKKTPASSIIVHKVQQVVFSHMYEKITPTMIAKKLDIALPYLCRHFKGQTGKTIATYVNEVKIDEAKRLLSSSDKSVLEIAEQIGYSSPSYMASVFKKITGTTPENFRRSLVCK